MKNRQPFTLFCCALFFLMLPETRAAEITGTIREVNGQNVTAEIARDVMPQVGDKATIFFKLAGVDEEVEVARAAVVKVDGTSVQLKIESATGEVAKDQFARITSANPQKRSATAAASPPGTRTAESATMAESEAAIRASLAGKWAAKSPDGLQATVIFKPDGTVVVPLQQTGGAIVTARYSIEPATRNPRIKITGIEVVPSPQFTAEELKYFQDELDRVRNFPESIDPKIPAHQRSRHLNPPVKDALLRSVWIGEIEDPKQIRVQGFTGPDVAAGVELGPEAAILTKLGPAETGPTADFEPKDAAAEKTAPQSSPVDADARFAISMGTVQSTKPGGATIRMFEKPRDGMPKIGDQVNIWSTADARTRVAAGKVTAVRDRVVEVKIESGEGAVRPGQDAHIVSQIPKK